MATDQRCECCGRRISPSLLEVHCIPGVRVREREDDPIMHILLLCPACHGSMHSCAVPEREQRLLIGTRTTEIESRIRKVFQQKAYVPPPSPEPDELFASALSSGEWTSSSTVHKEKRYAEGRQGSFFESRRAPRSAPSIRSAPHPAVVGTGERAAWTWIDCPGAMVIDEE